MTREAPDHDMHVRYTAYLVRFLDGRANGLTEEERSDARLLREWREYRDSLEHAWESDKSLAGRA